MQKNKAIIVLLSYSLLVFRAAHGALTGFSEEIHSPSGATPQRLIQLLNRSELTEADYLQAGINLQVCEHTNTIIYTELHRNLNEMKKRF